ncbi:MAG: hypothetical protein WCI95_04940, partial [bacterium]
MVPTFCASLREAEEKAHRRPYVQNYLCFPNASSRIPSMPHRIMNIKEIATYLHLAVADVELLV